MDRFLKESSKSYKECQVKNSARRNSLMKRTLGIEVEHKIAKAELSREEKQLREQLKHMQIEQTKTAIISTMRDRANSKSAAKKSCVNGHKKGPALDLDPYPVTFGHFPPIARSRANTMEDKGKRYADRRGRRQSKEFEDLHVNTATGQLNLAHLHTLAHSSALASPYSLTPPSPRRRLGSVSSVGSNGESHRAGASHGESHRAGASHGESHRAGGSHGESHRAGASHGESHRAGAPHGESHRAGASHGESHWAGHPEAIGSVRRARKSVEEQERDRMVKKEARLQNVL